MVANAPEGSKERVDKWLWAVRVFKTRSAATEACNAGRVRVNGEVVKPATRIKVGDRVLARRDRRQYDLVVAALIGKRVGAKVAQECYMDHSPPPEIGPEFIEGIPAGVRPRGEGRPTKRDRRDIDRLRGRG